MDMLGGGDCTARGSCMQHSSGSQGSEFNMGNAQCDAGVSSNSVVDTIQSVKLKRIVWYTLYIGTTLVLCSIAGHHIILGLLVILKMARRGVRLEEYAASGFMDEPVPVRARNAPAKSGHTSASQPKGVVTHAASQAHRENDKYMEEFDAAYEELAAANGQSIRPPSSAHSASARGGGSTRGLPSKSLEEHHAQYASTVGDLDGAWLQGPSDPEGVLYSVSAQPLMCMSMRPDQKEIVVGSSDHALYVLPVGASSAGRGSMRSLAKPRALYTKKFGHTEWVTCVTYLHDNRIVSGGMDSKLCLWDATGVKCEDLMGHSGSLSAVQCLDKDTVISAGYDKTVRVWNVHRQTSSRQREQSCIKAGSAPILDMSILADGSSIVVGDRDGSVHLLDAAEGKVVRKLPSAHRGHTTVVLGSKDASAVDGGHCFFSGGQDGLVKVWDTRQKSAQASLELHVDPKTGKCGAVGFLCESSEDGNILVTGGADGTVKVLDKRNMYAAVHNFTEHMDFIYSLQLHGQLCLSGAGNGMLHVHDWKQGKLLYGLGANQAAVRAIETTPTHLIAAGDDGGVVMYDMH